MLEMTRDLNCMDNLAAEGDVHEEGILPVFVIALPATALHETEPPVEGNGRLVGDPDLQGNPDMRPAPASTGQRRLREQPADTPPPMGAADRHIQDMSFIENQEGAEVTRQRTRLARSPPGETMG